MESSSHSPSSASSLSQGDSPLRRARSKGEPIFGTTRGGRPSPWTKLSFPVFLCMAASISSMVILSGFLLIPSDSSLSAWAIFASQQAPEENEDPPGICWPLPQMRTLNVSAPRNATMPLPFAPQGVQVHGPGCSSCVAGEFCTFTISMEPPAVWRVTGKRPLEWDLMINLRGPSTVHAYVALAPTPVLGNPERSGEGAWEGERLTFVATYRTWEAGIYEVVVSNPCFTLTVPGLPPSPYLMTPHVAKIASWSMVVRSPRGSSRGLTTVREKNPHQPIVKVQHVARTTAAPAFWPVIKPLVPQRPLHIVSKVSPPVNPEDSTPCAETLQSRWVRGVNGSEYQWTPYPCAREGGLEDWVLELADKGVREILFIGDSHLRILLLHAAFLLNASIDITFMKAHHGFNVSVPIPKRGGKAQAAEDQGFLEDSCSPGNSTAACPRTLLFNFLWVDGVYTNGENGCYDRGSASGRVDTFPNVTSSPDLVIVDSGAWSAFRCQEPALAYSSHLDSYLKFVRAQLDLKNVTKVIFFGNVPNPAPRYSTVKATNSLILFQAGLARVLSSHYGMHYFNSWEVVAPMYHLPCIRRWAGYDVHWSCATAVAELGHPALRVTGIVGEALVMAVFRFLTRLV